MNDYTVTIKNLYDPAERDIKVSGEDPMTVHKEAYMKHMKTDEEIQYIADSDGTVVFDLKHGFRHTLNK
jgi:hypothetical protein